MHHIVAKTCLGLAVLCFFGGWARVLQPNLGPPGAYQGMALMGGSIVLAVLSGLAFLP